MYTLQLNREQRADTNTVLLDRPDCRCRSRTHHLLDLCPLLCQELDDIAGGRASAKHSSRSCEYHCP